MPHAIADISEPYLPPRRKPATKKPSTNRTASLLLEQLHDYQTLYHGSALAQTLTTRLRSMLKTSPTPITSILSLGLGSLLVPKGQTRRLKQLALLLGLRETLQRLSGTRIHLYAQDPSFSRLDEVLLHSLDVQIVRTPSPAELGEAAAVLGAQTLVYAPFLTLDAYEQVLGVGADVRYLLGDDFDALMEKWPRYSAERGQVEALRRMGLAGNRRRGVVGEGFWSDEDASFPMAWYEVVVVVGKKEVEYRGKL